MEANFMRDYICCGITLDSLHELLQHYEEAHAQVPTQTMGRTPKDQQTYPSSRAAVASNTAASVQQEAQQQAGGAQSGYQSSQYGQTNTAQLYNQQFSGLSQGLAKEPVPSREEFDHLEDMEMDDSTTAPPVQQPQQQFQPQPQFGRQQSRMTPLSVNVSNAFQGQQGLRTSTPTTPKASHQSFSSQHNPTVSSVNTPTLGSQTTASQRLGSPDSSAPGTPAELDPNYNNLYGNFAMGPNNPLMPGNFDFSTLNIGGENDLTIDEPAKRLLSRQGYGNKGGISSMQFGNNSELARRVHEQQLMQGLGGAMNSGFPEEIKPFKCPVIGCEKAYKNQNGLKYHKQHGHQTQQLKENADGTYSIVDPTTSIPYPGTVGMEKEKPYRCEVCGKRYKNLNGLKYHRQHSPPCNPELKLNPSAVAGAANLQMPMNVGMNANVAGAGLLSMSDSVGF
ncbi:Transcriptional regulator of ribosomal biogenesis proteins [Elasticomyces elasticus]|nr:Transcriptional regulator of ribosomal biogenesis proteins [Elasticomyces elasticus]